MLEDLTIPDKEPDDVVMLRNLFRYLQTNLTQTEMLQITSDPTIYRNISFGKYKGKKISISQAIKEIENNKGRQFDPEVVHAFIDITKKQVFKNMLEASA